MNTANNTSGIIVPMDRLIYFCSREFRECPHWITLGAPTRGDFRQHHRITNECDQKQIQDQKGSSAIPGCHNGKCHEVFETNRGARSNQDIAQFRTKLPSFLRHGNPLYYQRVIFILDGCVGGLNRWHYPSTKRLQLHLPAKQNPAHQLIPAIIVAHGKIQICKTS